MRIYNILIKKFDDWCVQSKTYEDAIEVVKTLKIKKNIDIVEITPLSYPKYFFPTLQGTIYATREVLKIKLFV